MKSGHSSRLEKANAARRAKAEAGELRRLDPIAKAKTNPKSLRLAVAGKCWDCVCGNENPNPRELIRECPVTRCPLWPLRPYQKREN